MGQYKDGRPQVSMGWASPWSVIVSPFSAPTLLVGQQEGHSACKRWALATPVFYRPACWHVGGDDLIVEDNNNNNFFCCCSTSTKPRAWKLSKNNGCDDFLFGVHCVEEGDRIIIIIIVRWWERESAFLFQRLSVVIQRFNAILLHNSFETILTTWANGHSSVYIF